MNKIKNIKVYSSAYELLSESDPAMFPCLVDGMTEFFEHFDDFESYKYFLVDDETVIPCDGINGDVLGDPMTIEDLYMGIVSAFYDGNENRA